LEARFDKLNLATLQQEVKAGKFRPGYLMVGKEEFLADFAERELCRSLLAADERDLNLNIFYGRDADGLVDALMSPPIFAARRVVVVRHAQDLSPKNLDAIVYYLKKPPSDGCLILVAGDLGKKKTFHKGVDGLIESVECAKLKDRELGKWMRDYVTAIGKSLDDEAVSRLISLNWPGLRELAGELDRLSLLTGETRAITVADIEELGGGSFMFDRWKLGESVGNGDLATSMRAVENLQTWNVKPAQIVGDLFRTLRQLWFLRYHIDKKNMEQAKKELGLQEFVFARLARQAQRCPIKAFEDALLRIEEAELSIKRGLRPDFIEANLLVADTVRLLTPVSRAVR